MYKLKLKKSIPKKCFFSGCKTNAGKDCVFPFEYDGTTYYKCTTDGGALGIFSGGAWCATVQPVKSVKWEKNVNWDRCNNEVPACV